MDNVQIIDTKEIALTGGITRAEITAMVDQFKTLTVIPDDKESFDKCNKARMEFVHLRTDIDKNRKKGNEDARKAIKDNDKIAADLVDLFAPAETHLTEEVDREKARLKKIEDDKVQAEMDRVNKIQFRIKWMQERLSISPSAKSEDINEILSAIDGVYSETDFQEFKDQAKSIYTAVSEEIKKTLTVRLAWEEDQVKAKAEADRLAQVAAEQKAAQDKIDAENKRQADERAKIEAEKKALEDAKKAEADRIEREKREAEIREEARIRAEADARAKADREAKEKADSEAKAIKDAEEKRQREEAEKARKEALRPDKEKLIAWAIKLDDLINKIEFPQTNTEEGNSIAEYAFVKLFDVAKWIKKEAEAL
jgi:hypothetical protein